MCYIGRLDDDSSVAKMATEDIVVWKVGVNTGRFKCDKIKAPFMPYSYNKKYHKVKEVNILIIDALQKMLIYEGLHSYVSFKFTNKYSDLIPNKCYCKCYIPKGSIYFSNDEEIVSQELIFDKAYVDAPWYYKLLGIKLKCIHTWKD